MRRRPRMRRFFLLLVAVLSLASTAAAAIGQSEYLDIDCGKPKDYSYTDQKSGLFCVSDHQYVSTGETHNVTISISFLREYGYFNHADDLRSFPDGIRNCYTLPLKPNRKYLLRAWFLYGNYDGRNQLPEFLLYAGVNIWRTVKITRATLYLRPELLFVADAKGSMDLCLVNTGGGTPFINALELRALPDELYPQVNASQALMVWVRSNDGPSAIDHRFPTDVYDRWWTKDMTTSEWASLEASSEVPTMPSQRSYQPLWAALMCAAYPVTGSAIHLSYSMYDPVITEPRAYTFLHFMELQANASRVFKVTLNSKPLSEQVKPTYLEGFTVANSYPENNGSLYIELVQTGDSTLPPIINAHEIYFIRDMNGVETAQQDVEAIKTIKASYNLQRNWEGDPCSPISFMWEGVDCLSDGLDSLRIISLNLTSSGLAGEISTALGNLTHLQILDLSGNSLNGGIPTFLGNLPQLKILDLSGNQLDGPIPKSLIDRSTSGTLTLRVGIPTGGRNVDLVPANRTSENKCDGLSCEDKKKHTRKIVIPLVVSIGSILILASALVAVIIWRKKTKRPGRCKNQQQRKSVGAQNTPKPSLRIENNQFTKEDLAKITNNFQTEIGRGGSGPVYFGVLDNNIEVAVKIISTSSSLGNSQYLNEEFLLTRIHHRRLVSLVGFCNDIDCLAIIYEYMAEGSLHDHLHGRDRKLDKLLDWMTRVHIAIEVAQGLEYLHDACAPPIVHRDLKTNNILLNQNFDAKIADFGISKIFEREANTHASTRVMGTRGYVDPEYYTTYRLTKKSDVYSFGIVLLELITGLPAIIKDEQDFSLGHWVHKQLLQGNIEDIIDKRLDRKYELNSIWKATEIALACIVPTSIQRPYMKEVLSLLQDCLDLEKTNIESQIVSKHATSSTSNSVLALNMSTILYPSAR